jgi:signal transduction histidine kinase
MNSLINQTLDIDSIELQRNKLSFQKIDLAEILHQVENSFKYTLSIKKLSLETNLQNMHILADRNFLYLIFDNLLSNAIRFSPSSKKITIDLFKSDSKARVEISDEGPGMSQEAMKSLFDRPQTHQRQTDKSGLTIVKKYIEAMHGELQCKSHPGRGTTFIVQFNLFN